MGDKKVKIELKMETNRPKKNLPAKVSHDEHISVKAESELAPDISSDVPDGATCQCKLKTGDRAGEECGKAADYMVDFHDGEGQVPMCYRHKDFAVRDKDWVQKAVATKAGRIVQYGLIRECKWCFGYKGGMCPHAPSEDDVAQADSEGQQITCFFERGAQMNIEIKDMETLIKLREGLLSDDLTRLQRAKLMEFFEGGITDTTVDALNKSVRQQSEEIAKFRGLIGGADIGGGSAAPIQNTFMANIFSGMPGEEDEKPVDAESEAIDIEPEPEPD